jgi:drug/metabolite transporter (DMT)-like permease
VTAASAATVVENRRRVDPALLGASIAILAWGCGPLIVRGISADAYAITFFRMVLAVPVMFLAARVAGEAVTLSLLRRCLVPGFFFGTGMLIGFAAFQRTSIANATLIGALAPALILLGAGRFVGERADRDRLPFAVLSMGGMALVVLAGSSTSGASLGGDLLALVNLLFFTTYFLLMKRRRNDGMGSWAFLAAVFVVGTAVVAPVCALLADDLSAVNGTDWFLVAAMILGPGVIGHGLMTWASGQLPVTTSSLLTLGSPVVSVLGAWIVYDQRLGALQLVGAVLVLLGLLGVVWDRRSGVVDVPPAVEAL